jgi:hypothetical protein
MFHKDHIEERPYNQKYPPVNGEKIENLRLDVL